MLGSLIWQHENANNAKQPPKGRHSEYGLYYWTFYMILTFIPLNKGVKS